MAIRKFSEKNLTAEVLGRMRKTRNPRLKQVMASFIRHLHGFVREVRPTPEELDLGIRFMTEVGKWCDDKRQEFILLSDTTGVTILVDFINYGKAGGATESTVLGPFFVEGAPEMKMGDSIARAGTPGDPCLMKGTVSGTDGKPIRGCVIDVWEGDGAGFYDVQQNAGTNLRARFRTGADGRFWFRCIRPVSYPIPHDGPVGRMLRATGRHPMRPGHLHFKFTAPGYATLVTHLFARGDRYLDSDAVFGVKRSLVVDFGRKNAAGEFEASYDFVLKPARRRAASGSRRKRAR